MTNVSITTNVVVDIVRIEDNGIAVQRYVGTVL